MSDQKITITPKTDEDFHKVAILLYKSGKHKEALHHIAKAIDLSPRRASFHNHLGVIFMALKKSSQALKAFEQSIQLNIEEWDAWFNLGLLHMESGNHKEAIECMKKVTISQSKRIESWASLAICYITEKKLQLARETLEEAIKVHPTSNTILKNLGNLEYLENNLKSSLEALRKCEDPENTDSELLKLKARTQFKLNNRRAAIQCCDRAYQVDPHSRENLHHLVALYVSLNCHEKAKTILDEMLKDTPQDATLLSRAGMLYGQKLNLYKEGENYLKQSLSSRPDHIETKTALANILIICGRLDEAETLLNEVIEVDPEHGTAYRQLAHIKKMGKEDAQTIEQLEAILKDGDLNDFKKSEIHYALSDAYDQIDEAENAFKYISLANEFDKKMHPYEYQNVIDHSKLSLDIFDQSFFEERKSFGHASKQPIFIVGMPRSGTTLTEQILSSHPDVYGAGELKDIGDLRKRINKDKHPVKFPENIKLLTEDDILNLAEIHLDVLKKHSETAKHISDKMPFNFYALGFIHLIFPNAKLIYCRRNPLDNCLSCYFLRFSDKMPFSTDLHMLGQVYKNHERLMDHWQKVIPAPIHIVDYEKMVEDHENSCRALLDFCELEWNEQCLSFYNNDRPVKTASNWQVRQPIYNSSIGRWKPYREFLGPLIQSLELSPETIASWLNP